LNDLERDRSKTLWPVGLVSLLEIDEVTLESTSELLAADLDTPRPGSNSPFYGFDVRGWAIGGRSPVAAVTVAHAAGLLRTAETGGERPDVAAIHAEPAWSATSGFFLSIGALRLEPRFELSVAARLEDGTRTPVASISGRRERIETAFVPRLQPIGLTTLGRTGSTAVTRLIGSHPAVAAYRPFEFEPRVVTYWIDLLTDLADPAAFRRQVTPAGPLANRWWAGAGRTFPRRIKEEQLQELVGGENVQVLAELAQSRIDAFYSRVAGLSAAPGASRFVEKLGPATGGLLRELYPGASEVFLVRDFRDMVASTFAFNEKRGFEGFGRDRVATDAEYVMGPVATSVAELVQAWRARGPGAYLLRYEDLVLRPRETVADLLAYLELDASSDTVAAMLETLGAQDSDVHRTTAAERSVGRWSSDLAADVQEACASALGPALRQFGYE
jgi:Sulfotransferase family